MNPLHWHSLEPAELAATLAAWQAAWPRMGVLALVPEALAPQLPQLQTACRQLGVPLLGGIFPALITPAGFSSQGVWLLRLDDMPPSVLLGALEGPAAVDAQRLAHALQPALASWPAEAAPPTLLLLFDGLLPHIASVLDELYLRLADRVIYTGANAGSESFQPLPCLFDDTRVLGQSVAALLLPGPRPPAHGAGARISPAAHRAVRHHHRGQLRPPFGLAARVRGVPTHHPSRVRGGAHPGQLL